jgi:predicted O-linked N-acetylglucosamine transferase (SPINDLY family)
MSTSKILTKSRKKMAARLISEKNFPEARKLLEKVCYIDRNDIPSIIQLANVCRYLGDLDTAETHSRHAIMMAPGNAEAVHSLGLVLMARGMQDDALTAFKKALKLDTRFADAYNNAGNILATTNRPAEAAEFFRHALKLRPDSYQAHNNYGHALRALGISDEAEYHFRKAVSLNPGNPDAHSNLLLCLNYIKSYTPDRLLQEHKTWAGKFASTVPRYTTYPNTADRGKTLRIGYVSPDFRRHAVASFLIPILQNHDTERFSISCYSQTRMPDATTDQIRSLAGHWRDIYDLPDDKVSEVIRDDRIDILVDLAGHTAGNRLMVFARKPAPVQVTYLGYPCTTGLSAIDYLFADETIAPAGSSQFYAEKLIRLPTAFSCYQPPPDAPDIGRIPLLANGYPTFGSLNMLGKLDKEVICLWSQVLNAAPGSKLLIFRNEMDSRLKADLLARFKQHNISADRLVLENSLPDGKSYLGMYDQIDIALDTLPWNGHTTSCEALWMGVPVISLLGETQAGRMTASVLNTLDLAEFIAESEEEYIEAAAMLARTPQPLENLRSGLRNRMKNSPLCDGITFTRSMEHAYREIWSNWCASRR